MKRGCLVLVGVLCAALAAEWWLAGALGVPGRAAVAPLLALLATLALGSLQGVWQALRETGGAAPQPAAWRDGDAVVVEGTLQVRGAPPRAPFSGRSAVYVDYGAWGVDVAGDASASQRPHWRGRIAAPALLQGPWGEVALHGMPPVRAWPQQQFGDAAARERAVRHLATTAWRRAADAASIGDADSLAVPADPGADAPTQVHLMNAEARHALGFDAGAAPDDAALRRRLDERAWTFAERLVAPGERVTVAGTFRALPRRIDVGASPRHPGHAVHPGAAAPLAARQRRTTLGFAAALLVLALAAHLFVYADGGAHLNDAIGALGLAR
ncbi:MAG: hypothetical protein ACLGIT_16010 [Gammaproteobacteria bacterium]